MMIEVESEYFEFVHGNKPKGRGSWGFEGGQGRHFQNTAAQHKEENQFWFNGLFGESKKRAKAWAKERGFLRIEVLS